MAAGELRALGGKSVTTLFSQCLNSGGNGCRYPPLNTQSSFSKGTMSKFILYNHIGYRTLKCICSPSYRNITFYRRLIYSSKTSVELRGRMRGRVRERLEMLLWCDGARIRLRCGCNDLQVRGTEIPDNLHTTVCSV